MEDRLYKTSQLFNIRQISFLYNEISIFESAARNSFEKSRKYRARKLEVEEGNLVKKKKKRNCFYIIRVYVLGYVDPRERPRPIKKNCARPQNWIAVD